ncbi:MAG: FAD-dependent oxidoreductase [Clostridia bacterium]|nr:FAD-dependent oxidoreductase [Clostridia bacterium]
MENILDVAIIGGGPAGLSAAINAVARNKSVKILTNKSNYLQKAEMVDNYLGFHNISGKKLMQNFLEHVQSLNIAFEYGKVINIMKYNDIFMINCNGEIIHAKTVILALGVVKNNLLKNEENLIGRGVSYCATCDGSLYKGKNVLVYGNADDIIEEANFLQKLGVNVTLITAKKELHDIHKDINILDGVVTEIVGNHKFEAVVINHEEVKADGLFLLRNSIAFNTIINDLDTYNGYIQVNRNMETNISGLYACGDCTGEPLQISKATGEGLVAAQNAAKYIDSLKEMK